ncbi:MAG: anthranilate synthase component I family protein [Bacteroidales bacterium]|jgi:para-aminobenzoate synthetase component 1|nr:anthranilate synthase component I family protein [Bacteroidales bacterium]
MRERVVFNIDDVQELRERIIHRCNGEETSFIWDNINSKNTFHHPKYRFLATIGVKDIIVENSEQDNSFDQLNNLNKKHNDWKFGFMSYDLKNDIEDLRSENSDNIFMPNMVFVVPELVLEINNNNLIIHYHKSSYSPEDINKLFNDINKQHIEYKSYSTPDIESKITKEQYIDTVNRLKNHIQLGDIYEVNFCQEFFADSADIDVANTYTMLQKVTPTPFACYVKYNNKHLLCASPERFIKKEGNKIISQPIKGTKKRGSTEEDDKRLISELRDDPKERAENIMITDLVRNDLSHFAKKGSVKVDELCGIYTFPKVHQMISTISAELKSEDLFIDALKKLFPMGSMTGAPKIRSMQLIEKYEKSKRGLYSGSVGYIEPNGDADFNVVIRSILYNSDNKYLSFQVGGAITINSVPENEYDECLLKASAIMQILKRTNTND